MKVKLGISDKQKMLNSLKKNINASILGKLGVPIPKVEEEHPCHHADESSLGLEDE